MRTQVVIVGAGPSGLLLGQILANNGIDNIILERQTGEYVLGRIRAGILESVTIDALKRAKVTGNLEKDGLIHTGCELVHNDKSYRVDFEKKLADMLLFTGKLK